MPNNDQVRRTGGLLRYRRTALDPSWRDREVFAAAHHLSVRVINDLENGNRTNFSDTTIAGFEVAYRLAPGSLRRALAGGDLDPAPAVPQPRREHPGRFTAITGGAGRFTGPSQPGTASEYTRHRNAMFAAIGPDYLELKARTEAAPGASGWEIFPEDEVLAEIWNVPTADPFDRLVPMAAYVLNRLEVETVHRVS